MFLPEREGERDKWKFFKTKIHSKRVNQYDS